MVPALLGMVGLIVVAIGFGVWAARSPTAPATPTPAGLRCTPRRDPTRAQLRLELCYQGTDQGWSLIELAIPRSLLEHAGLTAPSGFVDTPLGAEETDDLDLVERYNRDQVRWRGNLALPPGQTLELAIPATDARAGSGTLRFIYERRGAASIATRFLVCELAAAESGAVG